MRFVAILWSLFLYVAPLDSNSLGNEVCYKIVKIRITRLDCSVSTSPPKPLPKRRKREQPWGSVISRTDKTLPKAQQPTSEMPTTQPPCKYVTERKFLRIPIHSKAIDPRVHQFHSPDFPHLPNMKIKCEWDVTGIHGKKYYVSIINQYLNPSLSSMANCLWIKGKGRMCNGNFISVVTHSNRLLMRMTIDPAETEGVEGGVNGFYLEYDDTAPNGGIPSGSVTEYTDGNNQTHQVLICNSTHQGPDRVQTYGVTRPKRSVRLNGRNSRTRWSQSIPNYKQDHKFIEQLFKTHPVREQNRPRNNPPQEETATTASATTASATIASATQASATQASSTQASPAQDIYTTKAEASTKKHMQELYEEEDVCEREPPQMATVSINQKTNSFHKRYFYNTSSGDCEEMTVTVAKHNHNTKENSFQNVTHCQRTCMNVCLLPMDEGTGNNSHTKFYYHNRACSNFNYKGNGGNANRFNTKTECKRQCEIHSPTIVALKAIKDVIKNPANAAHYKLNPKVGCLIQHLANVD